MITDNQFKLLNAILHSDFHNGRPLTERVGIDAATWTWDACEQFGQHAAGGVVAKALEAGLIGVQGKMGRGDDDVIWITPAGYEAWKAHKRGGG